MSFCIPEKPVKKQLDERSRSVLNSILSVVNELVVLPKEVNSLFCTVDSIERVYDFFKRTERESGAGNLFCPLSAKYLMV